MIAGLFALLAKFAVVQVVVYAGAIVVLITFVIMLLNLWARTSRHTRDTHTGGGLSARLRPDPVGGRAQAGFNPDLALSDGYGGVQTRASGLALFHKYFYPFEVVSLVVLAALALRGPAGR